MSITHNLVYSTNAHTSADNSKLVPMLATALGSPNSRATQNKRLVEKNSAKIRDNGQYQLAAKMAPIKWQHR